MTPAHPSELLPLVSMGFALSVATLMWLWQSDWGQSAEVFFGVRVPKGFEDSLEAIPIRMGYDRTVKLIPIALFAVYALILYWAPLPRVPDPRAALILDVALLLQAIGVRVTYWRARNETLPYAASAEAPHAASFSELKGPSRTWQILYWCAVLVPVVFVVWIAVFMWSHWLSSHLPIDTNLKLPLTIDSPPILWRRREIYSSMRWVLDALLVNLDAILVAFAFNYRSRFNEWGEEEPERQSYRKQLMVYAVIMQWILMVSTVFSVSVQTGFFQPDYRNPHFPMFFVATGVAIFVITCGIPLWLLNRLYDNRPPGYINRGGNEHWKLGLYYINRADSAAVVPTRFGVGETLNLGHPLAWAIVLVSLLGLGNRLIPGVYPVQATAATPSGFLFPEQDKTTFVMESEALQHGEFAASERLRKLHKTYNPDLWSSIAFVLAQNRVKQDSALNWAGSAVSMAEWKDSFNSDTPTDEARANMEHLAAMWSNLGFSCLQHKRKDVVCSVPYLSAAEALDPHASYAGLLTQAVHKQGAPAGTASLSQIVISGAEPVEIAGLQSPSSTTLLNLVFRSGGDTSVHVEEGAALDPRDTATLDKMLRFPWPDSGREQVIVRASLSCPDVSKPCVLTTLRAR